jgi:hypothetical protein
MAVMRNNAQFFTSISAHDIRPFDTVTFVTRNVQWHSQYDNNPICSQSSRIDLIEFIWLLISAEE